MKNCNGYNCKPNIDEGAHSDECILEHNHAVIGFMGIEHSEYKIKGYKGESIPDNSTDKEKSAWWEGFIANQDNKK